MPGTRRSAPPAAALEVAAVATLALSNVLLSSRLRPALKLPASAGSAVAMVLIARAGGATLREQGLAPEAMARGMRGGLAVGMPLGAGILCGAFVPFMRGFYQDRRIVQAGTAEALYQAFARIPVATAAAEELMFRGALEALLGHRRPRGQAILFSAVLFGLWHVLPTLDRVRRSPAPDGAGRPERRMGAVALAVLATGAAGVALSLLRQRSDSLLAPIVVHAAVNTGGFAGAWLASRLEGGAASDPGPAL